VENKLAPVQKSREPAIAKLMMAINGTDSDKPSRARFLSHDQAEQTLDFFKVAFGNPMSPGELNDETLKKNVTISSGLTYYDLRAPALNLFPTVTPLRNTLPRLQRQHPGDSAHWKTITSTVGSGQPFMGWVPEGQRSASMSYVTTNNSLSYMTIGEEDSLSEEARFAAEGFEDEDALVQLRLLLRTFIKEEAGLLGGDRSLALATPGTIVTGAGGTTSTVAAGTYSAYVVALTQEGFLNSSVANGVAAALTVTGNDGKTYVVNGGSSNKSAAQTQIVTSTQNLTLSVPAVNGAVAYAWYASTPAGSETLQTITTLNSVTFTSALTTTNQSASAITANCSTNTNYAFDGLLTWGFLTTSGAYVNTFATGPVGVGTPLTSSGMGSVNEIDTMFQAMWNKSLISPTVMYVNSQELLNLTKRVMNGASSPLLRFVTETDAAGGVEYRATAAGVVAFYYNPFTPDGGVRIPINIHPNLAPGTILTWAENLPPWYVSNAVPEVAAVQTRQDYYAEVWPKVSRSQYYGIYSQEVLAVYAPFAIGILNNISNS